MRRKRVRGGALLKASTGGLGFKEPALLICVTLPAYLLGRGRRNLKTSGGGTARPPNAKKRLGRTLDDGRATCIYRHATLLGGCGRARREGCEEGHSSQRTHKVAFLHRMTQGRRVFGGAGARRLLQSPLPRREGSAPAPWRSWKRRRDGTICQASSWPSWIAKPTDKRTYLLNTRVEVCSCPACLWQEGY